MTPKGSLGDYCSRTSFYISANANLFDILKPIGAAIICGVQVIAVSWQYRVHRCPGSKIVINSHDQGCPWRLSQLAGLLGGAKSDNLLNVPLRGLKQVLSTCSLIQGFVVLHHAGLRECCFELRDHCHRHTGSYRRSVERSWHRTRGAYLSAVSGLPV